MGKKKKLIWIFIIFLISIFGLFSATQQENKFSSSLQHEVTVTLKLIQIYVTDKEGNPVTDLEKTDFQLFDNKKLKTITEFEKHNLILLRKKLETEKLKTDKPAYTPTELPHISRKFLLFFDFAFNDPQGVPKAKKAALHFINTQLHPEDEVAVLSYDTFKGVTLHEYFTLEHSKVRKVVEGFGMKNAIGRAENLGTNLWETFGYEYNPRGSRGGESAGGGVSASSGLGNKRLYENQVRNYTQQIKDLARALRYIPGTKHILLFSGGVVNSILYGSRLPKTRGGTMRASFSRGLRGSALLRNLYEIMGKELAASNSPIYPVNTAGKGTAHFRERSEMGDYSLRQLAGISGGSYYDNITSYEEVTEKIQSITSSSYVLGYYIDEKWDGKYHKLKIKVNRKGCKVFGQLGYFNPKPFTKYTEMEKILHLIDLALSEKPLLQKPLNFPLLTLPFSDKAKPNLAVIAKTPGKLLKDISGDRMEVVTLIFDKENNITVIQKKRVSAINLARQSSYVYSFCSLSPGDYDCRVVIRNLKTGQGAVASSSLTLPTGQDSGFRLYPPLLLVPENNALYIKVEEKDKKAADLSLSDIYHFDSTQYAPVVKDIDKKIIKMRAVVRCFIAGIIEPKIQFSVYLLHAGTGNKIFVSHSILNRTQEQNDQIYLLELVPGELQTGEYTLFITVDELKTKTKTRAISEIRIK